MQYILSQKFMTIKDKFSIDDSNGNPQFYVEAKMFSFGKQFKLFGPNGTELFQIKQKLSLRPKWIIYRGEEEIASFTGMFLQLPIFRKYTLQTNFGDFDIKAPSFGYVFNVSNKETGNSVASIEKKLLKIADTYIININDDFENQSLIVAVAVIMDFMFHASK